MPITTSAIASSSHIISPNFDAKSFERSCRIFGPPGRYERVQSILQSTTPIKQQIQKYLMGFERSTMSSSSIAPATVENQEYSSAMSLCYKTLEKLDFADQLRAIAADSSDDDGMVRIFKSPSFDTESTDVGNTDEHHPPIVAESGSGENQLPETPVKPQTRATRTVKPKSKYITPPTTNKANLDDDAEEVPILSVEHFLSMIDDMDETGSNTSSTEDLTVDYSTESDGLHTSDLISPENSPTRTSGRAVQIQYMHPTHSMIPLEAEHEEYPHRPMTSDTESEDISESSDVIPLFMTDDDALDEVDFATGLTGYYEGVENPAMNRSGAEVVRSNSLCQESQGDSELSPPPRSSRGYDVDFDDASSVSSDFDVLTKEQWEKLNSGTKTKEVKKLERTPFHVSSKSIVSAASSKISFKTTSTATTAIMKPRSPYRSQHVHRLQTTEEDNFYQPYVRKLNETIDAADTRSHSWDGDSLDYSKHDDNSIGISRCTSEGSIASLSLNSTSLAGVQIIAEDELIAPLSDAAQKKPLSKPKIITRRTTTEGAVVSQLPTILDLGEMEPFNSPKQTRSFSSKKTASTASPSSASSFERSPVSWGSRQNNREIEIAGLNHKVERFEI